MSISAGDCYEILRDAILAVVVEQRNKEDRLWYYEGSPDDMPIEDRCFGLFPSENPRELEKSGCVQRKLVVEYRCVYQTVKGYTRRMLDDGDAIITAIWRLFSADIVNVQEPITSIAYLEGHAIYGRTIELDYISAG